MFKGKAQTHGKKTYTMVQTDRIEFSAHLNRLGIGCEHFHPRLNKKYFLSTSIQLKLINLPLPMNVLRALTKVTAAFIYAANGQSKTLA